MALASGFCVKDQMHFDNWSSRPEKRVGWKRCGAWVWCRIPL